jgi:hypothetical protein
MAIVRQAGLSCASSTEEGKVTRESDPARLPRIFVEDWTGDELASRLRHWFGDR